MKGKGSRDKYDFDTTKYEYDFGYSSDLELPQLYRLGPDGSFSSITTKENYWKNKNKNTSHEKIILELDHQNYPLILRQYGPEGAKAQAISMCLAAGRPVTKQNLEGLLTNLEEALEEVFESGVDEPQ